MIKCVELKGRKIEIVLQYKKVKNINIRIKRDGTVWVSANRLVGEKQILGFVRSKEDFILNSLQRFEQLAQTPKTVYFDESQVRKIVAELCDKVYPYFSQRGVAYPDIRFRRMVSQWGNCRPSKDVLTFNTQLMYAPIECIEYVVVHEFVHFLQPNHSEKFYKELEKAMPDWKVRRQKLKSILI